MKIEKLISAAAAVLALSLAAGLPAHAHDTADAGTVTQNFTAPIPNIPGKSLIAVEVEFAPGQVGAPHRHANSAFIYAYVVSGAIESKVDDEKVRIYRAGESWSERPGALHSVSRNVSETEPARLLAVFVVDSDDTELVKPIN